MVAVRAGAASPWKRVPRSGLQGAPAVTGWPWRRSRAPLSAPRRSAKVGSGSGPGISPVSYPQPRPSGPPPPRPSGGAGRTPPQARSPAARTHGSSAAPRGSPRTGWVTPGSGLRTCPLRSGSGQGRRSPPGILVLPAAGSGGNSGTSPRDSGAAPGAAPPGLKAKAWGWRGLGFPAPGAPRPLLPGAEGNPLALGLSCSHYVPPRSWVMVCMGGLGEVDGDSCSESHQCPPSQRGI